MYGVRTCPKYYGEKEVETTTFLNISEENKILQVRRVSQFIEVCVNGAQNLFKKQWSTLWTIGQSIQEFCTGVLNFCICNYKASKMAEVDDMPNFVSVYYMVEDIYRHMPVISLRFKWRHMPVNNYINWYDYLPAYIIIDIANDLLQIEVNVEMVIVESVSDYL